MGKGSHEPQLPNVRFIEEEDMVRIATKNLAPGIQVYGERLVTADGIEYRSWSPHRSKLAAIIEKGMTAPIKEDSRVLYLGGATGTTASHVSDMVSKGRVVVVEFSPRAMRDLLKVCTMRRNMVPVLADAARPASYRAVVGSADIIYQDVAQANQAEIALANVREFLVEGGYLVMVIKARSVDSTAQPKKVYEQELSILEEELVILEAMKLEPFHSDHLALVAGRKQL